MVKRSVIVYSLGILFALFNLSYRQVQENHAPVVKISAPPNNNTYVAVGQVGYQLNVSDKEDGDSRFDEINAKEVLLEVQYVKDKTKLQALLKKPVTNDPQGLAVIRSSNCFNCHNFSSKSLGPSFIDISKRYPVTKANTDSLANRIRNGSSGIWGFKEKMPSHPELSAADINSTVQWIMKSAANPDINYYNGLTGIIHLPENKKGAFLLTASYLDHGIKNSNVKHLKGEDKIVINAN
jgi:cytochrome c